jgi:hypothetical protein
MKIALNSPKKIIIIPEFSKNLDELNIEQVNDRFEEKIVTAKIENIGEIVLWHNSSYDAIGQWTDQDVIDRIKEIYNIV